MLCQKNGSVGAGFKGWHDDIIKEYTNMHKHPLIMYTSTENPKSKCRIFFLLQTAWLHESLEGLNGSLAHSDGELWPATVRGGIHPRLAFLGAKFWPFFGFWAISLDPDMLASQARALKTRFQVRNPKNHWANFCIGLGSWAGKVGLKQPKYALIVT